MWQWWNISTGKEKVEDGAGAFILERVEVGVASVDAVVLHELVSCGFDEESSHQLKCSNNHLMKVIREKLQEHV